MQVIRYLKKNEKMEDTRWLKVVFNEILGTRKKTWIQKSNKWIRKWSILLRCVPQKVKRQNLLYIDKFHKGTWDKVLGRKKKLLY